MSLVKKVIIVIAAVLLLPALICAETGWVSRGNIEISATGTIQITLPPQLHRLYVDENRESSNDLDLSLVGPDNNKRSFELFWRESGDMGAMMLKPDRVELKDDHSLVWEAEVPENYLFNSVKVSLPYAPDAARLNFYGSEDNEWEEIDKNVAVMRPSAQSPHGLANVKFKERSFEKVRIVFSGFDKNFKDAPIKSVAVMIEGRRGGMEYQNVTKELDFEEIWRDDILELRARMPGSGILIDEIEVSTEAFFKGKWRLGRERIVLGKADFVELTSGKIEAVDTDPNKIVIKPGMIWRDRMLIIQLESSDYFGKITSIKGNMRVPNLVFVADIIGNYQLQTGYNQRQKILEYAGNLDRRPDFILEVGLIEVNPKGQSETLVKDFAIQGGPFNAEGFTWKSPIQVENPGFYQLQVAAKVALENHAESLRIVRDGMQVPFFHGRTEQREEPLNYTPEYDAAKNQSIFTVRLPDGKVVPRELRIKTSGIFERKVILQKHQAGMVGWQNWKTTTCRNDDNSPIDLQLSLAGFPADQKDLRVIIENGSNQSLKIEAISALYQAQDLYFIANTSGTYELYGGHPSIKGAKYDLNIIQNKLLELFPEKISHGDLEDISADSEISVSGQDKGGPFESSGYQWVASFTVNTAGLCQLELNQRASLDDYRESLRIVRNETQIPYFAGQSRLAPVELTFKQNYDRDKNLTGIDIVLPVASKYWNSIRFEVPGVFSRKPMVMLRKPGKLGWKNWRELNWIGFKQNNSFTLDLTGLPRGETEMRIEIAHGDNSPIVVSRVEGLYNTQDLFFNAAEAGEYFVYGGNSKVKKPAYDIALIKDQLLKTEPQKVKMGPAEEYSKIAIGKQIEEVFSERGWGLYIVLALVTLILIGVIVKVFPEEHAAKSDEKTEDKKD